MTVLVALAAQVVYEGLTELLDKVADPAVSPSSTCSQASRVTLRPIG